MFFSKQRFPDKLYRNAGHVQSELISPLFSRSYLPNIMICKPELSQKAAKIYEENRYPAHGVCPRSCKKMKISTVYLARYVNEDKTASHVTFNFGKLIEVSVEVESYRFLNMVAEIGGKGCF